MQIEEGTVVLYTGYESKVRPAIVTQIQKVADRGEVTVTGMVTLVVFSCDREDAIHWGHTWMAFGVPFSDQATPHSWRARRPPS